MTFQAAEQTIAWVISFFVNEASFVKIEHRLTTSKKLEYHWQCQCVVLQYRYSVMLKNTEKTFEIKIETVDKEQITDIKTAENLLHVVTSENKIYVFDVKKGAYKGSIYFVKE